MAIKFAAALGCDVTALSSTSSKREEALEKANMVKDRFKGKRTKYYVLKAFSSTAEVVLNFASAAELATNEGTLSSTIEVFGGTAQEGGLLLDGVDIRTLNLAWLRRQTGRVDQFPATFALSGAACTATTPSRW